MSRTETLVKCIMWYFGHSALAPLSCLALRTWEKAVACVVGLPAMLLFVPAILAGLDDRYAFPVVALGYCVQFGLASGAICACGAGVRHKVYLVFIGLLVIDVSVALLFPFFLFLLMARGGE